MKDHSRFRAVVLCITGVVFIAALLFIAFAVSQSLTSVDSRLEAAVSSIQGAVLEPEEVEEPVSTPPESQNLQPVDRPEPEPNPEDGPEPEPEAEPEPEPESEPEPEPQVTHIVGIDPGHQSYSVDMSDVEPLGPGSSEMKAKASTGTEGVYTGLPEYELNLEVSLKLRDILEERGYQVVMTRTDNETAISNKERAQLVASEGAEIYVRIHANGEESRTVSGALGMVPSPDNPYVGYLSARSKHLSECILGSYCDATGFPSLGVDYYDNMTGINWSTVPVTILEMGFMTYESDDRQMSDPDFQEKMATGIADGIDQYFSDENQAVA